MHFKSHFIIQFLLIICNYYQHPKPKLNIGKKPSYIYKFDIFIKKNQSIDIIIIKLGNFWLILIFFI